MYIYRVLIKCSAYFIQLYLMIVLVGIELVADLDIEFPVILLTLPDSD